LRDATFDDLRAVSFVASDDDEARAIVLALSNDVGLDSIDAGPLATARLLDHLTLLWLATSKALGSRELALTLLRR
jgi:predicted dinucleotide-binding enzyme